MFFSMNGTKRIRTKMIFSFAAIGLLAVVISTWGLFTILNLSTETMNDQKYIIQPLDHMVKFAIPYGQVRSSMRDLGRSETEEDNLKHKEALETNLNLINQYMNDYLELLEEHLDDVGKDDEDLNNEYNAVKLICDTLISYTDICMNKLIPAGMNNETAAVFAVISDDLGGPGRVIRENIDFLTTYNSNRGIERAKDAEGSRRLSIIVSIVLFCVVTVSVVFLTIYVSGTIEKQLKNVIGKVGKSTQNIEVAMAGLGDVSKSLADGATTQAASIQQTSATMDQTTSMISQTAKNMHLATQLSQESKQSADTGRSKMYDMVRSMSELKESSSTISKIIKTIDDIAFQTNLLAINATIEAARAGGDAGKSFAVVADEVRNLAKKSAQSAADTSDIIEKNIVLTDESERISVEVASSLDIITEKFDNLNKIIEDISSVSEEQANGMNQINSTVRQMEQMTQQNAAMAEETASSAQDLQKETAILEEAISEAYELIDKSDVDTH